MREVYSSMDVSDSKPQNVKELDDSFRPTIDRDSMGLFVNFGCCYNSNFPTSLIKKCQSPFHYFNNLHG